MAVTGFVFQSLLFWTTLWEWFYFGNRPNRTKWGEWRQILFSKFYSFSF